MTPYPLDQKVEIIATLGAIIAFKKEGGKTSIVSLDAKAEESIDLRFVFISDDASYESASMSEFISSTSYDYLDKEWNVASSAGIVMPFVRGDSPFGVPVIWCTVNIAPFTRRSVHRFRVSNQALGIEISGGVVTAPQVGDAHH